MEFWSLLLWLTFVFKCDLWDMWYLEMLYTFNIWLYVGMWTYTWSIMHKSKLTQYSTRNIVLVVISPANFVNFEFITDNDVRQVTNIYEIYW